MPSTRGRAAALRVDVEPHSPVESVPVEQGLDDVDDEGAEAGGRRCGAAGRPSRPRPQPTPARTGRPGIAPGSSSPSRTTKVPSTRTWTIPLDGRVVSV